MNSILSNIKEEYKNFSRELFSKGKFQTKDTKVGFWGPSVIDEVFEAFTRLKISRYQNFLDLGSGDGRVAAVASLFCKKVTGIEYDSELHKKAEEIISKLRLNNIHLIHGDFTKWDLADYDLIFCNPDKPFDSAISDKIYKEFNGDLILYGDNFPPKLKQKESFRIDGTLITLYSNK